MKLLTILLFMFGFTALNIFAQSGGQCPAKIGDNYYLNCKHIITFKGQDVFTIKTTDESEIKINFDVFNEKGNKVATVEDSKLKEGNAELYIIKSTALEYSFIEKASSRIICYVKKVENEETNKCELQIWADMYMPSGFYFQCTPETTNVATLNMITGSTFSNVLSAIRLQ